MRMRSRVSSGETQSTIHNSLSGRSILMGSLLGISSTSIYTVCSRKRNRIRFVLNLTYCGYRFYHVFVRYIARSTMLANN